MKNSTPPGSGLVTQSTQGYDQLSSIQTIESPLFCIDSVMGVC